MFSVLVTTDYALSVTDNILPIGDNFQSFTVIFGSLLLLVAQIAADLDTVDRSHI
jgi:hypothetical protein